MGLNKWLGDWQYTDGGKEMKIDHAEVSVDIGRIGRIICYLLGGIFLLMAIGCDRGDFALLTEKYSYGDRVVVTTGFFKGCSGVVENKSITLNHYTVSIICDSDNFFHTETFKWYELERIK